MVPGYDRLLRRAREALIAKASRSAQAIVLVTDAEGLTLWVNGTFESVMGYQLAEMAGRAPGQVMQGPGTDAEALAAAAWAIRARQRHETRNHYYKKDGAGIWLDLEILPFFDEEAGLNGFVYLGQLAGNAGRAAGAEARAGCCRPAAERAGAAARDGKAALARRGGEISAEALLSNYPYKVLVAEDHPSNLKLVVALLQAAGCEAHCAMNGEQALAALDEADFDLIVMDSQMPVMTGIEAIAIIRDRKDWKRCIPILSLTAHAMKGAEEYHTSAGADLYMSKPLRSDCFIGAVKSLAQRGRDLREKSAGATVAKPPA